MGGLPCRNGKAFGLLAKHAASELVYGKAVTVLTHGKDKYKPTIADVIAPTSITRWSRMAGVSGIETMHQGMLCSKSWHLEEKVAK